MSNHERLQNYIARLKSGKQATSLVNGAKNADLTTAMKVARNIHVRSTKVSPNAFFVNKLEQELLVINEEGRAVHLRTWAWQVIPMVGAVALITIFTWRIMKPRTDIQYEKEGGSAQSFIIEEPAHSLQPVLVPRAEVNTTVDAAAITSSSLTTSSTK